MDRWISVIFEVMFRNSGLLGFLFLPLIGWAQIGDYSVQLDLASPNGNHNTVVYFEDSLTWTTDVPTFGWDGCCDAVFIPGSTPISFLYTQIIEPVFPNDNRLSINGMPHLQGSYSVPVDLIVGTSGTHNIIAAVENIPNGMTVELQDLGQNQIIDLLDTNQYSFQAWVGDGIDRFILHFNMNLVDVTGSESTPLMIYPTVAEDRILISGLSMQTSVKADIFSIDGRSIGSTDFNQENAEIDLSDLPSGIYILRLQNGQESHSFRFVKQ